MKKVLILISLFIFFTFGIIAQTPGDGGGPCDPCNENGNCYDPDACSIPVNNNISLLLIGGIVVGMGYLLLNGKRIITNSASQS